MLEQEALMSTSQRHYDHGNYKINLDDSSEKGTVNTEIITGITGVG